MSWNIFTKSIFTLTAILLIWTMVASNFGKNSHTMWIYIMAIFSFVIISFLIFLYAINTSASDNLFSFNNVVVASFLIKLFLSVGVIMFFERYFEPPSKNHILHFILVYIVYTIFEVYFLTKLARSSE